MSDYLSNLITRTFSPTVTVRPRLPSLFEPVPATRETKSGPELEQKMFVEQPPVTRPSEKLAPIPLSIPTSRQSMFSEPEQTVPQISFAKKVLQPNPESEPTVHPRTFPRAAPMQRKDDPWNSTGPRTDINKSPLRDGLASASVSHKVSSREETALSVPAVASNPVVVRELLERELPALSEVQAIVPTIRPLPRIEPVAPSPVTPAPSINVTIGRVEVRAVPPPALQQAKPKPAPVLSLEDYLRQRANGGRR